MSLIAAIAFAACPPPPTRRESCVHDGDTFWIGREKLRFERISAPELDGRCERERALARRARDRLVELLNTDGVRVVYTGKRGAFGRALVRVPGVGDALIKEGLAVRYGVKRDWCRD